MPPTKRLQQDAHTRGRSGSGIDSSFNDSSRSPSDYLSNSSSNNIPSSRSSIGSPLFIEVRVGALHYPFCLLRDQLCNESSWFKALLDGGFREAGSEVVHINEDIAVIKVFQEWLEHKTISFDRTSSADQALLVKSYCFADKYLALSFLNALMDDIFHEVYLHFGPVYDPETIAYAWDNLPSSSLLRRLILDYIDIEVFRGSLNCDEYPAEFWSDLEERAGTDLEESARYGGNPPGLPPGLLLAGLCLLSGLSKGK